MAGSSDTLRSPPASSRGPTPDHGVDPRRDTKPELLLRRALWRVGAAAGAVTGAAQAVEIDIAFTRWRLAVLVDGSFWHGHPSKWQPGRWSGYWDEKIKRNLARDAAQKEALRAAGWR